MKPVVLPSNPAELDESAAIWAEWGRITDFLESARIAFARERQLWTSLKIIGAEAVRFRSHVEGATAHRMGVAEHLAAIEAEDVLHASVLIHTYAIAEAAAAQRLTRNQRTIGAIEDWGTELLAAAGSSWDDVEDGLAGAVEVAVVRNACAHRSRFIDRASAKRLTNARVTALGEGDPVTLSYPTLRNYRRRLRLLLGAGGIGHGG